MYDNEMISNALLSAERYLAHAVKRVDATMEGGADKHPEVVVAFIHAAAIDCAAQQIRVGLKDAAKYGTWDPDEFLKGGMISLAAAIREVANVLGEG